ncbi:MAG: hypothetical protein E6J72_16765 [Deltaproteobacteria bacterium]|nr:MAG: hypothetical protein E6J72_16765 [Deltaproteobacteria bacterium]
MANGTRGSARLPTAPVALLLIDVVNPMDFDGADRLPPAAGEAAAHLAALAARARVAGVPVVYVNANFDCWHLGFRELVEKFERERVAGVPIIQMLRPEPEDNAHALRHMARLLKVDVTASAELDLARLGDLAA